ncbi:hypothetical protein KC955_02570 [Candidatus Saccharibacteria bacterium]|nr:hypothetical protein [Candidatus Saccharibacteria bacterium]
MEQSIVQIEQQLEHITEVIDTGLDDQSFFYASEQPDMNQRTLPTEFIMQRMMRVE